MPETRGMDTSKSESRTGFSGKQRLISVLYVDDEEVLLTVSRHYFKRYPDISLTTTSSVNMALQILEAFSFDVIISDYQMPGTNGIEFLKILQEQGYTIPFILFTGKGREEVVIEAINHGATYYIQKGGNPKAQFAELEHKIREASRRRWAEESLKETEMRYRTIFEHSGTAIMTLEEDLMIASVNAEFVRLTGYLPDEIVGVQRWTDIVASEDVDGLMERFRLFRRGCSPARDLVFHLVTKDRQVRTMSATLAGIPATGKCIVSCVDNTPLFQLREALKKKSEEPCSAGKEFVSQNDPQTGNA